MIKFKIVFIDGFTITIKAVNFSSAKVLAAYDRYCYGGRTHAELCVVDSECRVIIKK